MSFNVSSDLYPLTGLSGSHVQGDTKASDPCLADDVISWLHQLLGENFTHLEQNLSCSKNGSEDRQVLTFRSSDLQEDLRFYELGRDVYGFVIPFVFIIGLVGNSLSLRVFISKMMWKMSASIYLSALATSDMLVLVSYVLLDWLDKGLPRWPGGHRVPLVAINGMCQLFLFLTYTFRFLSVWLIVVFTIERYIGVCKPLRRREMCTRTFARRAILSLTVIAFLISLYKPLLSEVIETKYERICAGKQQYMHLNFTLDTIFALNITGVPFLVILCLNFLIVRKLLQTRRRHRKAKFLAEESLVKLEFTFILLVISTCFIALNLPYFITWCVRFRSELTQLSQVASGQLSAERQRGLLYITKTIFCINYSINFFLYSLTGIHFRRHLVVVFCAPSMRAPSVPSLGISKTVFSNVSTSNPSPRTSLV